MPRLQIYPDAELLHKLTATAAQRGVPASVLALQIISQYLPELEATNVLSTIPFEKAVIDEVIEFASGHPAGTVFTLAEASNVYSSSGTSREAVLQRARVGRRIRTLINNGHLTCIERCFEDGQMALDSRTRAALFKVVSK